MKTGKKILSILLALALAAMILPAASQAVYADDPLTTIGTAKITVTPPAAGTACYRKTAPEITLPSDSHYTVEWARWFTPYPECIHPDLREDDDVYTFEAGKTYRMSFTLLADEGYEFTTDTKPVIEGATIREIVDISSGSFYSIFVADADVTVKAEPSPAPVDPTPAPVKPTPVPVGKKAQTITASNVTKTFGAKAFSLGAKTSGDGKLTYSSGNTKVAAVDSAGKVTIKGAGTAKITIKAAATANYNAAEKTVTITVKKKANTLKASAKSKTNTIKYSALKKKNQTIAAKNAFKISGAKGKVTYKKKSGSNKINVSPAGKITVKKGLAKKTYTVKVNVTAAGNSNYGKITKTVTLKIRVK